PGGASMNVRLRKKFGPSRCAQGANIAEFAPAIIIFFLVILFPLIDLIGVATGYVTCYFATRQAASAAGVSTSFSGAKSSAISNLKKIQDDGFGKFARIDPIGGLSNTGGHIWLVRTGLTSMTTEFLGPDTKMSDGPDLLQYIYEYRVTTRQRVGPLVPLPIGLIADVPGLSSPFPVSITCCAQAEHPEGLANSDDPNPVMNLGPASGNGQAPQWSTVPSMPSPW
ncbi:hypothetical protein KF707_17375, partial [Candidatus Obscuribacterales bacterium]|nr:hypothetical protein [Candidatus Obscuribacterales bacterium]